MVRELHTGISIMLSALDNSACINIFHLEGRQEEYSFGFQAADKDAVGCQNSSVTGEVYHASVAHCAALCGQHTACCRASSGGAGCPAHDSCCSFYHNSQTKTCILLDNVSPSNVPGMDENWRFYSYTNSCVKAC